MKKQEEEEREEHLERPFKESKKCCFWSFSEEIMLLCIHLLLLCYLKSCVKPVVPFTKHDQSKNQIESAKLNLNSRFRIKTPSRLLI